MATVSERVRVVELPRVKVSSKNQIAIPADIRRKLHIKPGDHLVLNVRYNHVVVSRDPKEHPEDFVGPHPEVWGGVDIDEYVRGERED